MSSSTTTAVELAQRGPESATATHRGHGPTAADADADADADPVLAASRLADSTVPDGGYGWVVVAACAVVTWWFVGTSYSWGVIQAALVEDGVATPATLSFVGSLSTSLISALAIVNGRVVRAIGTQATALLGVALLGLAEILTSFAVQNVTGLFFTSGLLLGLGMSLCFMVSSPPNSLCIACMPDSRQKLITGAYPRPSR